MKIITSFTQSGVPKEGLSPTIKILKLDGTIVINNESMTEIGSGFYKYEFATYDEDEDYCISTDGTSSLSNYERYNFSTNEKAPIGKIFKIEKGKWEIKGNQMLFYDNDNTTVLYSFNLQTKNGSPTERDVFKRIPV